MQMSQSTKIARAQGYKQEQFISQKFKNISNMIQNGTDPLLDMTSKVQADYFRQLATDN